MNFLRMKKYLENFDSNFDKKLVTIKLAIAY